MTDFKDMDPTPFRCSEDRERFIREMRNRLLESGVYFSQGTEENDVSVDGSLSPGQIEALYYLSQYDLEWLKGNSEDSEYALHH